MPSSVIRHVDYDAAARRLVITFVTGRRYAYEDVGPAIVTAFLAAPSKGGFFNRRIRDRFPCQRLRGRVAR